MNYFEMINDSFYSYLEEKEIFIIDSKNLSK